MPRKATHAQTKMGSKSELRQELRHPSFKAQYRQSTSDKQPTPYKEEEGTAKPGIPVGRRCKRIYSHGARGEGRRVVKHGQACSRGYY